MPNGESSLSVIEEALAALGVETLPGIEIASITSDGLTTRSGERIPAATVVWYAGMTANPLTRLFPVATDVTILDLGPWGAVYTEGWDRCVVTSGDAAKRTKHTINCERIYPPLTGNRAEIAEPEPSAVLLGLMAAADGLGEFPLRGWPWGCAGQDQEKSKRTSPS